MARRIADGPCGLVQVIRLPWTKSARGGEGARARSAVPEAFEIPAAEVSRAAGRLCVDIQLWGDRDAFAEPYAHRYNRVPIGDGFDYGCIGVSQQAEGLQVQFEYDQSRGGAPDRWFLDIPGDTGQSAGRVLIVRSDEWVRVRYNGRFSCIDSGNWWYERLTVNVGWFAGIPDGRVFLDRKPSQELSALAGLR